MSIFKLIPECKDYIWGGNRLIEEYGINAKGDICAEAWVLSGHKDGYSTISTGIYKGMTLDKLANSTVIGKNCDKYTEFPILIKLIDAKRPLSIQVHPDDAYALKNEGEYGKTEMWYVLAAEEGSYIYIGFEKEVSKEEFKKRIEDNTLEEILHKEYVKAGDVVYIEPGTLHAIGSGIMVAEIQRSSNITYRIYDYGRLGANGKPRALHVDKALDVLTLGPCKKYEQKGEHLVSCDFFCVDKVDVTEDIPYKSNVDESSFVNILVIDGECKLSSSEGETVAKKGDSFFIEAGTGEYSIHGKTTVLVTKLP